MADYFALNDAILVRKLRHINDDVASCAMSAETETIGAVVAKGENFITANLNNLITTIFLVI